jgi:hypothetical protein
VTLGSIVRVAAITAAILTATVACGPSVTSPSASPSPEPTASGLATPSFVITTAPTPRPTLEGTPGPRPTAGVAGSASIQPPPPRANATPSPTPDPEVWRIEGYVVDQAGKPLDGVCIVLGPTSCQVWSPKTDDRGYYFIDIAKGNSVFDIFFEMPGHKTVWWKAIPQGPTQFNVILANG